MKKRFLLLTVLIITLFSAFLIISCTGGGTVTFDLTKAKAKFVTWIGDQVGVPAEAVGNYVGTFNASDVIGSYSPGATQTSARQAAPMHEAGWLFYLDEQPGGFYSHPGRIVAIGLSGQVLFTENTQGWPTVNGVTPDFMLQKASTRIASVTTANTVYNPSQVYIPVAVIRWPWVIQKWFRLYGAVTVQGLTPIQSLYYEASQVHDMMTDAMEDLMGATFVQAVDYPNNAPADIATAVAYLVNTKKVSNITLYFIAHGNIEYMSIGGSGYWASTLKTLIDAYPNVRFNLIFETCHGGSWTDYFQALGSTGVPNVDMSISSTSRTKGAYPDWDYSNGLTDYNAAQDEFVEFTSDFILQMEHYTDATNWPTVTGLTTPAFTNNKLKLYYLCYTNARNRFYPVAGTPSNDSYVLTERTPISVQDPQIYYQ
jgi:hypothetical protein